MPKQPFHAVLRPAAYLWAGPNTLAGILAGLVILVLGGRLQLVAGVAEFHGGLVGRCLKALPPGHGFLAITFGHVIIGLDRAALAAVRRHEHVHVRQYERWGPFFLPAYGLSSLWQSLRGRRMYRDNFFERQAYGADPDNPGPS